MLRFYRGLAVLFTIVISHSALGLSACPGAVFSEYASPNVNAVSKFQTDCSACGGSPSSSTLQGESTVNTTGATAATQTAAPKTMWVCTPPNMTTCQAYFREYGSAASSAYNQQQQQSTQSQKDIANDEKDLNDIKKKQGESTTKFTADLTKLDSDHQAAILAAASQFKADQAKAVQAEADAELKISKGETQLNVMTIDVQTAQNTWAATVQKNSASSIQMICSSKVSAKPKGSSAIVGGVGAAQGSRASQMYQICIQDELARAKTENDAAQGGVKIAQAKVVDLQKDIAKAKADLQRMKAAEIQAVADFNAQQAQAEKAYQTARQQAILAYQMDQKSFQDQITAAQKKITMDNYSMYQKAMGGNNLNTMNGSVSYMANNSPCCQGDNADEPACSLSAANSTNANSLTPAIQQAIGGLK